MIYVIEFSEIVSPGWTAEWTANHCQRQCKLWRIIIFPWIGVVFFTAVKNLFTSEWKQRPRKSTFQVLSLLRKTVRNTGCSVRGFWVIISRFSRPSPRKSLDNHSKTSHRASCFPHSFLEVVELENYYFKVTKVSLKVTKVTFIKARRAFFFLIVACKWSTAVRHLGPSKLF